VKTLNQKQHEESSRSRLITMLLYSHFPSDVRPRKEAFSFIKSGSTIVIYCLGSPEEKKTEMLSYSQGSIKIRRIMKVRPKVRKGLKRMLIFWFLIIFYHLTELKLSRTVIHSHDLNALPAGFVLSWLTNNTLVYDSHELFPESFGRSFGSFVGSCFLILEKICFKRVTLLIGVTDYQLSILSKRSNCPSIALPNYPSLKELPKPTEIVSKDSKTLIIGMTGSVTEERGHFQVLKALEYLHEHIDSSIEFWIVGDGAGIARLQKLGADSPIKCIFYGYIPYDKVWDLVKKMDLLIVANQPSINCIVTSTNRPYEYALLGVPFIAPHYPGISDVVEALSLPKFDPRVPKSIVTAILKMLEGDIKKRGSITDIRNQFSWENNNEKRLLSVYGIS
jgi:glycosyltransferase involved in cell wall biosynthesis